MEYALFDQRCACITVFICKISKANIFNEFLKKVYVCVCLHVPHISIRQLTLFIYLVLYTRMNCLLLLLLSNTDRLQQVEDYVRRVWRYQRDIVSLVKFVDIDILL
jgi:hypothetical protein